MTTVIGLGYAARSGKDTVAKAIIEARGDVYDIRRYAFGDELKIEVNREAQRFGSMWSLYQYLIRTFPTANLRYDHDPDATDPLCPLGKQRSILQWWGTEYRRAQDRFYWVKKLVATIQRENPQFAIITDVRFDNELALVKSLGGHTVKVTREGITATDLAIRQHVSETNLINAEWDYEITAPYHGHDELTTDAVSLFDMIVCEMNESTEPLVMDVAEV